MSSKVLSGYIHTTWIIEACDGGGLSIDFSLSVFGRVRLALLLSRYHFIAGSQVNSRRYHLFFCMLICPPVSLPAPEKTFQPSWAILTVSSVGVLERGPTCTI